MFVILSTFWLTIALFVVIPTRSQSAEEYDPWADINDDGWVNAKDAIILGSVFGSSGTPLEKAALEYDSGWLNIADKAGQNITVAHNLSIADWNDPNIMVEITGRTVPNGSLHRYLGLVDYQCGWNKTYGGWSGEGAHALIQTIDGGYALAGLTYTFGAGYADFWLVKTDAEGNISWSMTYGGTNYDGAFALLQTSDGGYVLAGYTDSLGAGMNDILIVKTDSNGNTQWNKTYGGTGDDWAEDLVETDDGGYAITGRTSSYGAGNSDFWLVKTDVDGNIEWNKTYGGSGNDWAYALFLTNDGGYALAGYTGSYGVNDFWLVKTDADGNHMWNQTYGGTSGEMAYALVETSDGGYALSGYTASYGAGNNDFWLVKTDTDGNHLWNKTYGGPNQDCAYALVQTLDDGYALAGYTASFGAGQKDFWFVRTDSAGNQIINMTYGWANEDRAHSLVQTADGGYALAGYALPVGEVNSDFWLIKTDANGNTDPTIIKVGLTWIEAETDTITLLRGSADPYWNYVKVRIWKTKQTP